LISDDDSVTSSNPQVGVEDNNVFIVWSDGRGASLDELYYANSSDNGDTWSENKPLTSNDGFNSRWPHLAMAEGVIHIIWGDDRNGDYNIYYKNSTDGGVTWSDDRRLTFWVLGMDGPSAIDVDRSHIHVLFTRYVGNWEGFYMKSDDGGLTWSSPIPIADMDGRNSMARDLSASGSMVSICWSEWKLGAIEIFYRNSTDNGTTWNPEVKISNSGVETDQCSIAISKEIIHVVWYDLKPGNREIYYRNSTNSGIDWNDEIRLTFNAGVSVQPDIEVNDSFIHVVWLDITYGGHVFHKRYPDFGPETNPPTAPTLLSASLTNNSRDVRIFWAMGEDEGFVGGTSRYLVNRAEDMDGPYLGVAEINASRSSTYMWIDIGAGEGDPKNYFYHVESVDASDNTNRSGKAAKLSFHLNEGKHLLSTPLVQQNESTQIVLQTLTYDVAWSYNSVNKEWTKYSPFRNYNDLLEINHKMGFWVNVTDESNLTVAGLVPTVTIVNLSAGWNLVSFPSFNSSYTISDLKVEVGATRVEGFDPSSPPYNLRVVGDAEVLQTGEAYWVKVDAGADWIIEVS